MSEQAENNLLQFLHGLHIIQIKCSLVLVLNCVRVTRNLVFMTLTCATILITIALKKLFNSIQDQVDLIENGHPHNSVS